jgi:methionyl aminopeptidase
MIDYKTESEIELMRQSCLLVSSTITEIAKVLKPGITTLQLDKLIGTFIRDNGATPSFLNYRNYPFNSCISVNDVVVHGFPNVNELKEKDIISIDIGVYKNKFHGDHAYTFSLGDPGPAISQLIRVTKESLYLGIEKARTGNRVGDISAAIQDYAEKKYGYGVVRELVGHGLGRHLHEDPQVPNYGKRGSGAKMKEGMVLAIEPMINMGSKNVYTEKDGWTVRTFDHKPSVHFEHNVSIQKNKADLLSDFNIIERAEKNNVNLFSS